MLKKVLRVPRFGLAFVALTAVLAMAVMTSLAGSDSAGEEGYWPQWRGPFRTGVAPGAPPLHWDDSTNVGWKVEIPGRGHSTPVIWGDRLFLTTAVPIGSAPAATTPAGGRGPGGGAGGGIEHRFDVLALDRHTGRTIWQHTATTATPPEGYHRIYGSFASNAPATDGKRVYAFFGSRGLYAYDMDGTPLWQKDFGVQMRMRLQFGEGAAVVVHDDRLILNFDHEGDSFISMLEAATGREVWRTPRDEASTWSTPFVAEHGGGRQIIVTGTSKVRSYAFETGALVWELAGLGSNPIPQPVQHGDLVFVMSGHRSPNLMAVRLGRTGDLTGTDAVVWSTTRGVSYTPSPVLHESRLYVLTDSAQLSAFDAATGEAHYQQARMPGPYNFKASPVAANGRLYLATEEGDVVVVKLGDTFEVLATNTLTDQSFIASPAIAGNDIFLRSRTHLFRIGAGAQRTSP